MPDQKILIVDDQEDISYLLAVALRDKGFSVATTASGAEALTIIAKEKPCLLILDLSMPEMSAEEVCRVIKTDPALRDILIMILSAKGDLKTKLHCLNLGAEEYLVKPIDIEELVLRVTRFLSWMNQWQGSDHERKSIGKERSSSMARDLEERTLPTIHLLPSVAADSSLPASGTSAMTESIQEQKSHYGIYRIESLAGKGGMGVVYKARDDVLDRYVAIKVLSKEWSSSREFLERFHQEARLIAAINHAGIAQIYTFAQEAGESYFALQWCPGGSLSNLIRDEKNIELLPAIDMVLQCARALDAAYMKGVIHRDIKPSNLMFDENQQIKIVDFGVASSKEMPQTASPSPKVMGSPVYMPPEQGKGEHTDHRSDIYSLGITFYQMLYGRLPFSAKTPMEWVAKHAHENFPPYDDLGGRIPRTAYQIIEKMTQKDPVARYQKHSDLIKDLERLQNELYSQRRLKIPTASEVASAPSFKSRNLYDLLANVFRQERSGLLKVSWGFLQKRFLISRNELVHFESPQADENVWSVLAKKSLMKSGDVPSSEEDPEESLNRLLFLQSLTIEDFKTNYRETMMESMLQVFRWPVVEAEFFKATIDHDPFARISIARILMDAASTVLPYETVIDCVPKNQTIVRSEKFGEVLTILNLPGAESFLVSRLEGQNITVGTLQLLTGFTPELIFRTVYALERMGALEYRSPVELRPRRIVENTVPESRKAALGENVRFSSRELPFGQVVERRSTVQDSGSKKIRMEATPAKDVQAAARHYTRAQEKYKAGQYWEVERLCAQAIKNNPAEAKFHHLMALALVHHPHSVKAAEESFHQAVHLNPQNLEYRLDLANFLLDRGRLDDALKECQKILELSPHERSAKRLRKKIESKR